MKLSKSFQTFYLTKLQREKKGTQRFFSAQKKYFQSLPSPRGAFVERFTKMF
jgi:hypothetical protein